MTKKTQSLFAKNLVGKARFNPMKAIRDALDDDSYEDFERTLDDDADPAKAIIESLELCGVTISASSVQRWKLARRGK